MKKPRKLATEKDFFNYFLLLLTGYSTFTSPYPRRSDFALPGAV
jgi:hypothetical protein